MFVFVFTAFTMSIHKENAYAKTQELHTCLVQKSNELYQTMLESGSPVAYKVKLNKKTIVIYGSMDDYDTFKADSVSKHVYKLDKKVQFVLTGGNAKDIMNRKEFKKYLSSMKNSGLGLDLTFKKHKVVRIAIAS